MSGFLSHKARLPELGVGLGLRRELASETFVHSSSIDWVEIIPENYMDLGGKARERLAAASSRFPIVPHGINLSIGSADELNKDYLKSLSKLLDKIDAPWWSDHLCFTSVDGVYMQDLLPLPLTEEAAEHIGSRAKTVQEYTGRPFLLENISFYMHMPGSQMPEPRFIRQIVEAADCGILLDVNNVYVNSVNHGFDPFEFINQMPLERVVQIHVAGHKKIGEYIIDTHGAPVIEPVYRLLKHALERTQVKAILLERDQNYPEFEELIAEIDQIKGIAAATGQFAHRQSHVVDESVIPAFMEDESSRGREVRALSA